jgi:D-alanyl-D-alanine carboxypeptidase/D-alanyl-D-alanine-endopeptidase (penicillin-binding protein 4)
MIRKILPLLVGFITTLSPGQEKPFEIFINDTSMVHASVSLSIIDAETGSPVFEYQQDKSLAPASIMKLITSSAALEVLGPDHMFTTSLYYTGSLNKSGKTLKGDIIVKGGGDPTLGSDNFKDHYGDFMKNWVERIRSLGINRIDGSVISDDSYFDYMPVPSKWLWEDLGNYYGAGVYGLSVYDNTYEIHFRTSGDGSVPVVTKVTPEISGFHLDNYLTASGSGDNGYIFSPPYSNSGWISGTIPVNQEDFVLKGSIPDPPLFLATILDSMLVSEGIEITGNPTTSRLGKGHYNEGLTLLYRTESPPLRDIIKVLNRESVNLYAETLLKEMGKDSGGNGSTSSGVDLINSFLDEIGISRNGMHLTDGSGLSPANAVNARGVAGLLLYMKNKSGHFEDFFESLPEGGKNGTLSGCFLDHVFDSRLRAKSGSMTRVRGYAGYLNTLSDRELIFCIIINNFSGPSAVIVAGIESILKDTILKN